MLNSSSPSRVQTIVIPVDDIALLYYALEEHKIGDYLDALKPRHGNWCGASIGKVLCVWLCYLLSESDHRLSLVESWVAARLPLLQGLTGVSDLRSVDFSDDKLAYILACLSNLGTWDAFVQCVDGSMLQVYRFSEQGNGELPTFRLDSAPMQSHGQIIAGGLLQYGHHKHHPDLQQFKVNLVALDNNLNNFAFPIYSLSVSGNTADDVLYIPLIEKVLSLLGHMTHYAQGNLFVGDKKFGSIENRASVRLSGNHYLCPLSLVQVSQKIRTEAIEQALENPGELLKVYRPIEEGQEEKSTPTLVAQGFIQTIPLHYSIELPDGKVENIEWNERRLFVCSLALADSQAKKLDAKLQKVEQELEQVLVRKQGKTVPTTLEECQTMVDTLLKDEGVTTYLQVQVEQSQEIRQIRAYKGKPARTETINHLTIKYQRDHAAIEKGKKLLGWQVYATDTEEKQLDFEACVWKYRAQSNIESRFNDLRNKIVPLLPLYLHKEEHIIGLVNLLTLALKVCTIIEYKVAEELHNQNRAIEGLYQGNPKRKTEKPSIKRILNAFQYIFIVIVYLDGQLIDISITTLNKTQQDVLDLAGMTDYYKQLPQKVRFLFSG